MSSGPTRRGVAGALVLAVLVLAGCGIPLDDEPRPLSGSVSSDPDAQSPATGDASDDTAYLFYVHNDGLVAVSTQVSDRNPDTVLTALLTTRPTGPGTDTLISQIPAGTRLLNLERAGSLVRVDLSEEFAAVNGPALQLAVGQIVLTLTDLQGISSVGFRIEGKDATVSSPRGDANEVGTCDVVSLLDVPDDPPSTSIVPGSGPGTGASDVASTTTLLADGVDLKRIELMAQCPGA